MSAIFCELRSAGLIAARGADASAFLQAQLTSDVAGMSPMQTQYSGYCSPKGRLLATFLVWRAEDAIFLQLPAALRETVQTRLAKYVLRAKVTLEDASASYRIFGVAGSDAPAALAAIAGPVPEALHEMVAVRGCCLTRLSLDRFVALVPAVDAENLRAAFASRAAEQPENAWEQLDIENGVPLITPDTQERFVPQMVNLDRIGGVSYTKGCYPGQEIVARMHYLGRLKQRMYRVHVPSTVSPSPGDALYSAAFGPDQASGTVVNAAPADAGFDALAVLQTEAAAGGDVRWKSPDGPLVEFRRLPYPLTV